ncbi:hypothetical protein E2C01_020915 [Portunus trituberculatus]|uniref:Uncharacterized protein n=1 Tax=Portunus trituberculatus TaxID=210409 RepID=A0A5B7E3K4_PORTR|nr:hypothetical protein [Portunus trituberculatus]
MLLSHRREEKEEYKGIQRKEQTATALLGVTKLSICLCYHYRFYELEAERHQGSRKENKRA